MSSKDFYSSKRLKGVKVNSDNEFVGYVYFRGNIPDNVIMEDVPKGVNNPVWDIETKKWTDKG